MRKRNHFQCSRASSTFWVLILPSLLRNHPEMRSDPFSTQNSGHGVVNLIDTPSGIDIVANCTRARNILVKPDAWYCMSQCELFSQWNEVQLRKFYNNMPGVKVRAYVFDFRFRKTKQTRMPPGPVFMQRNRSL